MSTKSLISATRFAGVFTAAAILAVGTAQAAFVTVNAPTGAAPGATVQYSVALTSQGAQVSSLAVDVGYTGGSSSASTCTLNPSIVKPQTSFRDRPNNCTPGTNCTEIRAGVTSFDAATAKEPLPDGTIYTCSVTMPSSGSAVLTVVRATATDPDNVDTDIAAGSQGAEIVVVEPSAFVTIGSVSGAPGATVTFPVSLTNFQGSQISSLAVDFGYTPGAVTIDAANCALASGIVKPQTSFRNRPNNCTVGGNCDSVRAGVTSFDAATAKEPLPDGVIFTCQATIPAGASLGTTIPVNVIRVTATDPDNVDTDITGNSQSGSISVEEIVVPTDTPTIPVPTDTPTQEPTPTPTEELETPTPTPTTLPSDVMLIKVGRVRAAAGTTMPVDVTLFAGSALQVAGTQNDIGFESAAQVRANASNRPDCTVNPAINKGGTSFAFQPSQCTPGDSCTGMRSFVLALDNVDPIPTGSVLYSCNIAIAEGANDAFPLECTGPGGSTPTGGAIDNAVCEDGCADVPEGVAQTIGSGGSISTGDAPTDIDPTETTLTSPNAGVASILEEGRCPGADGPPAGLEFVGLKVTARAPAGSPAAPVQLEFRVDAPDVDASELIVLHNGERVDDCIESGVADPEPCVQARDNDDGYIQAVVLASNANARWEFAVELPPTPTATFTEVPTPTATPPSEVTNTPTSTPTNTRPPTGGNDEDDGCAIVAPADSHLGWMLFVPAAVLIWRRRRAR